MIKNQSTTQSRRQSEWLLKFLLWHFLACRRDVSEVFFRQVHLKDLQGLLEAGISPQNATVWKRHCVGVCEFIPSDKTFGKRVLRCDEKISLANLSACCVVDFIFTATSSLRSFSAMENNKTRRPECSAYFVVLRLSRTLGGLFCCCCFFLVFFCRESFRNFLCSAAVVLLCFPFLPIFPLRHNKKKRQITLSKKSLVLRLLLPPVVKRTDIQAGVRRRLSDNIRSWQLRIQTESE
jgi:hypothetical protein